MLTPRRHRTCSSPRHGTAQYSGEPVTQLEHALQTAYLAEQSEADDELVTACLLHDLGHLLNEQGETPTLRGIDDTPPVLRAAVPARPVPRRACSTRSSCHVDAKRYLCRANDGYWAKLSDDSKRSLSCRAACSSRSEAAAFLLRPARATR